MLIRNGSNFNNLSFLGGALGSRDYTKKSKSHVKNGLCYGSKYVSNPVGYYAAAINLPISVGGIGAKLNGTSTAISDASGAGNVSATLEGQGNVTYMNLAGGYNLGATLEGLSTLTANIQAIAGLSAQIRIGANPSADDVVYALLDTPTGNIDNLTLRQTLQVLLSVMAGKTAIDTENAVVKFRDMTDTTDRLTVQMSGSERIDTEVTT